MDEDCKRAYRDFVMRQRLVSEDGDLEAECASDELSGIEDSMTAFRAFLRTDLVNNPDLRKRATAWFDMCNADELGKLRREVGIARPETQRDDRWTREMSKNELCQIIRRHCPKVDGKRVGSHGSRFFDIWIKGRVEFEQKSPQRYLFNFEHLIYVFGDGITQAAEALGAD